jgi:hypothetical protein
MVALLTHRHESELPTMRNRLWALLALAAACSPAADQQAAAPAAADTAAVRAELQSLGDRWIQYAMAGDAATVRAIRTWPRLETLQLVRAADEWRIVPEE